MKRIFLIVPVIVVVAFVPLVGCKQLPPSKPLSQLTPREAAGREVFKVRCGKCHSVDPGRGMNGPTLFGLFRKPYLPSGGVANDDRVEAVIMQGRGMMPAQAGLLDQEQLADLMAYLHTL